jgi:plasmid stabilization system protein ParE
MSEALVLKKPLARIDLAGCYAYIAERNPEAANRFRQAAEATFTALAKSPGTGAPYPLANPVSQVCAAPASGVSRTISCFTSLFPAELRLSELYTPPATSRNCWRQRIPSKLANDQFLGRKQRAVPPGPGSRPRVQQLLDQLRQEIQRLEQGRE